MQIYGIDLTKENFDVSFFDLTSKNASGKPSHKVVKNNLKGIGKFLKTGRFLFAHATPGCYPGVVAFALWLFRRPPICNSGRILDHLRKFSNIMVLYRNNYTNKYYFEASMMPGVEYLVIAVRKKYRTHYDFDIVNTFLETMYVSNRIKLPLKGILLIGY